MKPQTTHRVAANVRAELAARRMTAAEFADAMCWHKSTAHRRLTGATPWSIDDVEDAASVLSLTVEHLIAPRASEAVSA